MQGESRVESVSIDSPNGLLAGALHLPAQTPAPVIICCHGLLSSKNGSKFVALGQEFSSAGWAVLRFDFAGCGDSLAVPRRQLVPSRLADLRAVIGFALQAPWSKDPMGLMGSSMGGYISLLSAAELQTVVKGVVCWATPYDLTEIHPDETRLDHLVRFFPLGFELGQPNTLGELSPVSGGFVLHGQMDEIVPWQHGFRIFERLTEPRKSCFMSTAEHRFLDPQWRNLAIRMSRSWFEALGF